jgi:hypothetical protein
MNHGRANVPINYCPECGLRFQSTAHGSCNMQKHTGYRKQRFGFCLDCGIKL